MVLSIDQFKQLLEDASIVLVDARMPEEWIQGHIPNSLNITPATVKYAVAMGMIQKSSSLVFVLDPTIEKETIAYFNEAGFDNIKGYLAGGFSSWENAGYKKDMLIEVEADELAMDIPHDPNLVVVDVRRETEYADGHLKDAQNLPLHEMTDVAHITQFDDSQNLYIHCAGGYRSVIAASILKKEGIHNLRNVLGGWAKIKEEKKLKIEKDVSVLN